MNKVILIGNLTKDPELRYTPNGVAICTFTVAVNKRVNGENQADFINVVAWQKTADLCATYLRKGRQAAIEGRLQSRSYDDKEGKRRYVTEVVAENVEFLGGKEKQEQPGMSDPFADPFTNTGQPIIISDDDLPF
ncbi:single-stranded DNA-binding protein [Brevibacillus borstelensis]|uniref:single-stranded DNA-binding protein n=1 Tax=Brevibacillus borstelensis TaxID=45462 RepID=UPI0004F3A8D2|nr:single-stranded DNA-binding protein [Brevibacillus borstelensis]KKX54449.1 single-stranded DNA-binding protein [Brevibacillus borstelensis cifa_chp40]